MIRIVARFAVATTGSLALAALLPISPAAAQSSLTSSLTITGCASLNVTSGSGTTNVVISCNTSGQTPPTSSALGTCTVGPSGQIAPLTTQFTVSCSGGTQSVPTSVDWVVAPGASTPNYTSTTQGPAQTINFTAGAILYATARDANNAAAAQTSVSIASPAGTGNTGDAFPVGFNGCQGFTKTLTKAFNWTDAGNMRVDTATLNGGMGNNGALVATFVTPATGSPTAQGAIGVVEYPGTTTKSSRTVSISRTPCDFNAAYPYGGAVATTTTIKYMINSTVVSWPAALAPGTRYYVNIANMYKGQPACTGSTCDLRLEITRPNGL